jgi:hypothetical protein
VSELIAQVGDVEVLVNNAGMASLGVLDPTGPLEDMATATWAGASYLTGQLIVIDGGNSVVEDKGQ